MFASESTVVLVLGNSSVSEALTALDLYSLAGFDLPLVAHDLVAYSGDTLVEEASDGLVGTVDSIEVRRHTCTES